MVEYIAEEASKFEGEKKQGASPLRQIDITVGAGLMLLGVKISLISAFSIGNKFLFAGLGILLVMMGIFYGLLFLLARSSPRRRGLMMGIHLMFVSALFATILAPPTEGVSFLIAGVLTIPLTLLWSRLIRFFFDVDPTSKKIEAPRSAFNYDAPRHEFSPVHAKTTANLNPPQPKIDELVEPFSVTEDSTELLKNKRTYNPS